MPTKLNIGSGSVELEGFTNIDRKDGKEAFPLDVPDGSVEEIYASHVLEHFSHTKVSEVVNHWVSKLVPGGRIRIAVPNFEWIAKHYLAGDPINSQGYTMGGQTDDDDYHRAMFDRETLAEVMMHAGLERIADWESMNSDCASLEVSLNLEGFKPISEVRRIEKTSAILSAPRFGAVMHFRLAFTALGKLGIPYQMGQGAYWQQVLSEIIEMQLATDAEFILTLDYDTIFRAQDVLEMYRLMKACPECDAIMPVQAKRSSEHALFGMVGKDGKPKGSAHASVFQRYLTQVSTGHFGCTLFRADSLRDFPRPWFVSRPNDEGKWSTGKTDADIDFWHKWRACGKKLHMANGVVVGHLQELITWPTGDFSPVYQTTSDYDEHGIPPNVERQ